MSVIQAYVNSLSLLGSVSVKLDHNIEKGLSILVRRRPLSVSSGLLGFIANTIGQHAMVRIQQRLVNQPNSKDHGATRL